MVIFNSYVSIARGYSRLNLWLQARSGHGLPWMRQWYSAPLAEAWLRIFGALVQHVIGAMNAQHDGLLQTLVAMLGELRLNCGDGSKSWKMPWGNGKTYWNDVKIIKLLVISHHFSPSEQALHFKASGKIQ